MCTEQHESVKRSKRLSKDYKSRHSARHVCRRKGLKSHQPLRTLLLLLNWPEPPAHKTSEKQFKEESRGWRLTPPPPPPSCLLQPIEIWQLLVVYWTVWTLAVNSDVLTACDCLEGKWERLTLLTSLSWWLAPLSDQPGKQWPRVSAGMTDRLQTCIKQII